MLALTEPQRQIFNFLREKILSLFPALLILFLLYIGFYPGEHERQAAQTERQARRQVPHQNKTW